LVRLGSVRTNEVSVDLRRLKKSKKGRDARKKSRDEAPLRPPDDAARASAAAVEPAGAAGPAAEVETLEPAAAVGAAEVVEPAEDAAADAAPEPSAPDAPDPVTIAEALVLAANHKLDAAEALLTAASDKAEIAEAMYRAALKRGELAEAREKAASERTAAIEARERAATERDELAAARDRAATDRDAIANRRDRIAARRDRQAGRRPAVGVMSLPDDDNDAELERARLEAELQRAHLDALTGAFRREVGRLALRNEIERARRADGKFVIAFIDVDGLKGVNDRDGHAAGDRVLRMLGATIRANLRSYDPVVRYGGDEFVCGIASIDAGEVQHRIAVIDQSLRHSTGVGITAGLATLTSNESLDELTAKADEALLEAKRNRTE
jgi:diguanylate cyclase (GGDEF)-like protein